MKYEYDDPYILLAHYVLARYSRAEVERFLTDDTFVYKQIVKEMRNQDFMGAYLDAIISDMLENKKRMKMYKALDELSMFFFKNLDLKDLRDKIIRYGTKYNII